MCVCIYMCVYVYICVYVCICVCIYLCVHICVCVCIYIYVTTHTVEQYSAIKMNEIMPFVATWMDMGRIDCESGTSSCKFYM